MKSKMVAAAISALILSTSMAGHASATETVKVGLCVSWPIHSIQQVVKVKNLLSGYDIEQTNFEDPIAGHSALAACQIDILYCTNDYAPIAAEQGANEVNVTLTDASYGVDQIALAPKIEAKDLKDKKLAAPQAFIGQLLMGVWLDSQGIKPGDVTWVNLNADEAIGPMIAGNLAGAYLYEPWLSKLTAAMPGARSVATTADPDILKTGMFMDVMFMNKTFISSRRQAALDLLKAHWLGVKVWNEDTAGANKIIADFLKWPVGDVESVVGKTGKSLKGGVYILDFNDAARLCGVLDGEPPLGLKNGQMYDAMALTNKWWLQLGLMKTTIDPKKAVDCSLMGDLVKAGFRQSMTDHS